MATLTEYIPYVMAYLIENVGPYLPAGTEVLDGPPPTGDELNVNPDGLTQWLWIGGEGSEFYRDTMQAAEAHQGFAFLDQARTRDDQIEILCAAECGSGDSVMLNARGSGGISGGGAFGILAGVELMLRGSLGTSPPSPGDAGMGGLVQWSEVVGPIGLKQQQNQQGAWACVPFRVSAFVRLTS